MPLYLVGTPIGNLEDITLRALRVLREVQLIAAEDTRTTRKLLAHYDIHTPLTSYHDFSSAEKMAQLLGQLATSDVALVSEAGMPGLSDPGYRLVQLALEANVKVVPVPGPTAAISALVASGLATDQFLFLGFLPRQQNARRQALAGIRDLPLTLVCYEAPRRLLATLADIEQVLGNRQVCVARELTKLYEELWRGTVTAAQQHFAVEGVRGEITLLVAGADNELDQWSESDVIQALNRKLAEGLSKREAAAIVAEMSGWRKKQVYQLSLSSGLA